MAEDMARSKRTVLSVIPETDILVQLVGYDLSLFLTGPKVKVFFYITVMHFQARGGDSTVSPEHVRPRTRDSHLQQKLCFVYQKKVFPLHIKKNVFVLFLLKNHVTLNKTLSQPQQRYWSFATPPCPSRGQSSVFRSETRISQATNSNYNAIAVVSVAQLEVFIIFMSLIVKIFILERFLTHICFFSLALICCYG